MRPNLKENILTAADEKEFRTRVANTPVIVELVKDMEGLKKGQLKLEDKMDSLEKNVISSINNLASEIKEDKLKGLKDSNDKLSKQLDRKNSNGDKVKNGSILTLLGTIVAGVANHYGFLG